MGKGTYSDVLGREHSKMGFVKDDDVGLSESEETYSTRY
jgi:hypothetical protein